VCVVVQDSRSKQKLEEIRMDVVPESRCSARHDSVGEREIVVT